MKEVINEENKSAQIIFEKDIYSIEAIKRALSDYTDSIFIKIEECDEGIRVNLEAKEDVDIKKMLKELYNSVLEEDVRYNIENETKNIRDMVYEKALKES